MKSLIIIAITATIVLNVFAQGNTTCNPDQWLDVADNSTCKDCNKNVDPMGTGNLTQCTKCSDGRSCEACGVDLPGDDGWYLVVTKPADNTTTESGYSCDACVGGCGECAYAATSCSECKDPNTAANSANSNDSRFLPHS